MPVHTLHHANELFGKPYQPSNGTEGVMFYETWCCRCMHDRAWREKEERGEEPDGEDGCDIFARTLVHDVEEPEYPSEWIHDRDGEPCCTAFVQDEGENNHYKCPDPTHPDLFWRRTPHNRA